MSLDEAATSASRVCWSALRVPVAALALVGVGACFEDPPSSSGSGGTESAGTGSTSTTSATQTTETSTSAETTTTLDPDSSGGTTGSGSSSAGSESGSSSTGGDAIWRCADQPEFYACESFEGEKGLGAAWSDQDIQQVSVSQESDDSTGGTHRHYELDGADGLGARTSVNLDVGDLKALHVEFALRFHTDVDACSTGTGGDLTVLSMVRPASAGSDEQLILQVGPTAATLYSTGAATTNVVLLEPSEPLEEWFQVALDLTLGTGAALLTVGGVEGTGTQQNWMGTIEPALDFSFGPASDNDGDTFNGCQFDIDNVVLRVE